MNPNLTCTRRTAARALFAPFAAAFAPRAGAQSCAPPAGVATPFVPLPGLSNIQRKPISALNAAEITRLRLAYKRLRDLTTSNSADPRGWMQQAMVHCWQCGGAGSGIEIHGSWTFLPWHRAYLYFHERILCKLLNDNSFRLPYWSWDVVSGRNLPTIYRPATVGATPNSLFNANRSTNASTGVAMPASIFPAASNPMNAANFAAFGGSAASGGGLENGPHGAIHMFTGRPTSPFQDMGNLSTAARDPIFFAHHCQIDRLWAEWVRRNPVAHANPTGAAFLTRAFQFFDESSVLRTIRTQQVLNTVPLGFSYPPGAALSKQSHAEWMELISDATDRKVKLPEEQRPRLTTPSPIARTRSLIVEDAKLPSVSGLYNVFAGDPAAAGADQAAAPNYLGYIGLVLGEHAHQQKSTLVLNASQEFLTRAARTDGVVLTYAEAGSTQGKKLEYAKIYLTEE
jgi:polyphenol oxidase